MGNIIVPSTTTGDVLVSNVNPFTTALSPTNSYILGDSGSTPTFKPASGDYMYYLFWNTTTTDYSIIPNTYGATINYVAVGGGQNGATGGDAVYLRSAAGNRYFTGNGGNGGSGGQVTTGTIVPTIITATTNNAIYGGTSDNTFTVSNVTGSIVVGMNIFYESSYVGQVFSVDSSTVTIIGASANVQAGQTLLFSGFSNNSYSVTVGGANNNTTISGVTTAAGSYVNGNQSNPVIVNFEDNTGSLALAGIGLSGSGGSYDGSVGGGASYGINTSGELTIENATIIEDNFINNTNNPNISFSGFINPNSNYVVGQNGLFGGGGGGGGGGGWSGYSKIQPSAGGVGGSGLVLMYYQIPSSSSSSTAKMSSSSGNQLKADLVPQSPPSSSNKLSLRSGKGDSVLRIGNPQNHHSIWLDPQDATGGFHASIHPKIINTSVPLVEGIEAIKSLKPIKYTVHNNPRQHSGFMAPGGDSALAHATSKGGRSDKIGDTDTGFNTLQVVPYTVAAIQEQNTQLDQQKAQLEQQKAQLEQQKEAQAQQTEQLQKLQQHSRLLQKQNRILANLLLARKKR